MKRKYFVIICLLFLSISKSTSQEHLDPNYSIFNEYSESFIYYSEVRNILLQNKDGIIEAQYLVLPSFRSEYVLNIIFDFDKRYSLQYITCDKSIYSTMKWYPKNKRNKKVKLTINKKYIDENVFESIRKLFENAINKTKYSEKEYEVIDGETYYFMVDNGNKSGQVRTPHDDGKIKRLISVGEELIEFLKSNDKEISQNLLSKITSLSEEFK